MDYYKIPMGFGMALARNFNAMNVYSAMSDAEKETVLESARNVRSEQEMQQLINSLAGKQLS